MTVFYDERIFCQELFADYAHTDKSEGLGRTTNSLNPHKIPKLFFGKNVCLIL
jgi:hypothetical protein